jgi:hypothetical protein
LFIDQIISNNIKIEDDEETAAHKKIIQEYQDLNEKCDKIITKIKARKNKCKIFSCGYFMESKS